VGEHVWDWAASWEGDQGVWTSPVRRMKKGKEREGGKGQSGLVSCAVGLAHWVDSLALPLPFFFS